MDEAVREVHNQASVGPSVHNINPAFPSGP